jgi:hypothetical protein
MRLSVALIAAALLLPQSPIHAQEKKNPADRPAYKVEFNIHDTGDATAKAGRRYMMLVNAGRKGVFKSGSRVPVATGSTQPSTGGTAISPMTQYTYVDVGVTIECLVNGGIAMQGNIDLSTAIPHDAAARTPNPTLKHTRVDLDAAIEPGKPTVIAAIEDPADARQFQVEVTITRVN